MGETENGEDHGWAWSDGTETYGPFATRDQAVEDARSWVDGDDRRVIVARVVVPDLGRYVRPDLEYLLETVNDRLSEDEWGECVDVRTTDHEAEISLWKFLKTWADEHLKVGGWRMSEEEEETVDLDEEEDPRE